MINTLRGVQPVNVRPVRKASPAKRPSDTGDAPSYTRVSRMGVSLCMIVRNEAENLRPCLEGMASLFRELHIVDTGSTDDTPAIARSLGAHVGHFAWCDDYAAARNASMAHATEPWIFWLDADDRVDAENQGPKYTGLDADGKAEKV
jgi:glycosyltransferase involved in cell wall biosynthesis